MPALTNQPTRKPTRKVMAGALAGVIAAAVLSWLESLAATTPVFAFAATPAVGEAVPVLAFAAAAYLFRDRKA